MAKKNLNSLYSAVSSNFDIGDYATFESKMQTADDRKKFYDVVTEQGFDLGDYQAYESRLSVDEVLDAPAQPAKKKVEESASIPFVTGAPLPIQNTQTEQGSSQLPSERRNLDILRGRSVKPMTATANEKPIVKQYSQKKKVDAIKRGFAERGIEVPEEKIVVAIENQPDNFNEIVASFEDKDERDNIVATASVTDLVTDRENKYQQLKNNRTGLAEYQQSRQGKVAELVSDVLEGNRISEEDFKYLQTNAPNATKEIFASSDQYNPDFPIENINVIADQNRLKNESQNREQNFAQITNQISNLGNFIDVEKLGTGVITEDVDKLRKQMTDEIALADRKYEPVINQNPKLSSFGTVRNNPQQEAEIQAVKDKYEPVINAIANAEAFTYAKKNPTATPLQIGLEWMKIKDPTTYQVYLNGAGKSKDVQKNATQIGISILESTGDKDLIAKGEESKIQFDTNFPDSIKEETLRRLGLEKAKSEGGVNTLINEEFLSLEEADQYANQLPQKYKDVYFNQIRPNALKVKDYITTRNTYSSDKVVIPIPKSGGIINEFVAGVTQPIEGTLNTLGGLVESDEAKANRSLKPQKQKFIERKAIESQIKELESKDKLEIEDINKLNDLKQQLELKSKNQVIADGMASLTGQVVAQGGLTMLGAPIVSTGLKTVGLGLRGAGYVNSAEQIANYAGQLKNTANISGSTVAYLSSYDDARLDAERLMPKASNAEKLAFASGVATLNAVSERIFKDEKIFDAFKKEIAPEISVLVKNLSAGKITEDAFQTSLTKLFNKTATKFVPNAVMENQKEAIEEGVTQAGTTILKGIGVATGAIDERDFNMDSEIDALKQVYLETTISGLPTGVLAGAGNVRRNNISQQAVYDFSTNPQQIQEFIDVINYQKEQGTISEGEAITKIKSANTLEEIGAKVIPNIQTKKALNEREKVALTSLFFAKRKLTHDIEVDPDTKTLSETQLKEVDKKIDDILLDKVVIDENYNAYTPEEYNKKIQHEKELEEVPKNRPILVVTTPEGKFEVNNPNGTKEIYDTQKEADDRVVEIVNETDKIQNNENTKKQNTETTTDVGQPTVQEQPQEITENNTVIETQKPIPNKAGVSSTDAIEELTTTNTPTAETATNDFTAKSGNKVVDEKGEPITVYHSTYDNIKEFDDRGVSYFSEDENYSREIAKLTNGDGRASNYIEERQLNTIPANIRAERVYELPEGTEMNSNVINALLESDPKFKEKYDAVKGIDLYSKDKIAYAVFDNKNIKIKSTPTNTAEGEAVADAKTQKSEAVAETPTENITSQLNTEQNVTDEKQISNEVDVRQQAKNGGTMDEGNTKSESTTTKSETTQTAKETVTPEQEKAKQELIDALNKFNNENVNNESEYENSPNSESVTTDIESKAESDNEVDLNEVVAEADAIIEEAVVETPKNIRTKKAVVKKIKEIVSLKRANLKEQKEDFLSQLNDIRNIMLDLDGIPKEDKEARETHDFPYAEADFYAKGLREKGYEVTRKTFGKNEEQSITITIKDDGEFTFAVVSLTSTIEAVNKYFPSNEQIKSKQISSGIRRSPQSNNYTVALSRGSLEKNQQFADASRYNVDEAKKVLAQAKKDNDKSTQRSAEKLLEVFEEDLKYQQGVLESAKSIDFEVETNKELQKIARDIDARPREVLDAIQKYGLELNESNAEKALFLEDIDKNYGGLDKAENRLLMERSNRDIKLEEFRYKNGKAGYKQPTTNNKKAEFNRLINDIETIDKKLNFIKKENKSLSKIVNEKPTENKLEEAKQELKDAYNKLKNSGISSDPIQDQKDFINLVAKLVNYARLSAIDTVEKLIDAVKDFATGIPKEILQSASEQAINEIKPPKNETQETDKNKEAKVLTETPPPPPDKPIQETVDESAEDETGIAHRFTEETRKSIGLPEYAKETITDEELDTMADDAIAVGYDIKKLVSKMSKGTLPTALEQTIMKKYLASLEAQIEKNPTDELISDYKKAVEASDAIGSELGRSLRSRRGGIIKDDSIASYFLAEMEANQVDELTQAQKEKVEKEYNDIQEANKKLQDKIAQLEIDNARLIAEKNISKGNKNQAKKEDLKKQKEDITASIKQKLKEARGQFNSAPIPYLNEIIAIAPDVAKLVKVLVEEGIIKLDEIVDNIHAIVKESSDNITTKDIVDIIAGNYNEKKQTRSEISKQLLDLRTQANLVNKLESLENGVEPKTESRKIERNKEIASLRKKINENYLTKLASAKNSIQNQIDKLNEDLKSGNFLNKEENTELKLDKEAIKLKDDLIKLKGERALRLLREEYKNRSLKQKATDTFLEVINVPRTIMSSTDFSAPLRQGLVASIAHPTVAFKAFVEMFRQAVSQKRFDRWFHDVKETELYDTMQKSGLYVADPHDLRLSAKEEQFMNNLAEKIPFIGGAVRIPQSVPLIGGKKIGGIIKGSERAYVSYLNKMRVDLFTQGAKVLESMGKTYDNSPKEYEGLASFINNSTGRGKIGKLEPAAPILNSLFFSPRLIASRLNLLNPLYYAQLPPYARKMAIKDMLTFVSFGVTALALIKLQWGCPDDCDDCTDCVNIELDPRSTDFGKMRIGNTRYDTWGGFQQYVRILAQMMTGEAKSSTTGKIREINGEGLFGKDRADVAGTFVRGKLAPVPASILDLVSGRNIIGEEVGIGDVAKRNLLPLIYSDVESAYEEQGAKAILTAGLPAMFGIGVNTYDTTKKKKKD